MRAANPAVIPRNHLVEEAIFAAVCNGDFAPFDELIGVLAKPYEDVCNPAPARSGGASDVLWDLEKRLAASDGLVVAARHSTTP